MNLRLLAGAFLVMILAGGIAAPLYFRSENAKSVNEFGTRLGVKVSATPAAARDFTIQSPDGRPVRLRDFRGKLVMLNFWATWCGPCRSEMPSMEVLYQRYKDRGLVVLAVSAGEDPATVKEFVDEYHFSFPVAVDSEERVLEDYKIWSIPTTYFIDPEGKIVGLIQGSRIWDRGDAVQYVDHLISAM